MSQVCSGENGEEERVWRHLSKGGAPPSLGLLLYAATWLIIESGAPTWQRKEGIQDRKRLHCEVSKETKFPANLTSRPGRPVHHL